MYQTLVLLNKLSMVKWKADCATGKLKIRATPAVTQKTTRDSTTQTLCQGGSLLYSDARA